MKLLRKSPVPSTYTFEDFLVRMQRSSAKDIPRLYVENKPLFVAREDMLQRCLSSVSWEKATLLMSCAYFHQPLSSESFRCVLGGMLLAQKSSTPSQPSQIDASGSKLQSSSTVSWQAAMRVVTEAYIAHGGSTPSVVVESGLRLLQPTRQWNQALRLLRFAQANQQLSAPMLLEAATCCATPHHWRKALQLLGILHQQKPDLLIGAIQSLIPATSTSAYALLPQVPRTRAQKNALRVIGSVIGSVPASVLMSNALCLSYMSHLFRSPDALSSETAVEALGRLNWKSAMTLMCELGVLQLKRGDGQRCAADGGYEEQEGTAQSSTSLQVQTDSAAALVVTDALQQQHMDSTLMGAMVRRMPSLRAVDKLLLAVGHRTNFSNQPCILLGKLAVAVREAQWKESILLVSSLAASGVVLRCKEDHAMVDTFVAQLLQSGAHDALATEVAPRLVPLGARLSHPQLLGVMRSILAVNRRHARHATGVSKPGAPVVPWEAALGWASLLSEAGSSETRTQILRTGSSRNTVSIPTVASLSDPKLVSILVHVCVLGGSPQGALRVLRHAKEFGGTRLAIEKELHAMLYCMLYDRRVEAGLLLQQAKKRQGKPGDGVAALEMLYDSWNW